MAGEDCPRHGGVQRRSNRTTNTRAHSPQPLQPLSGFALIKLDQSALTWLCAVCRMELVLHAASLCVVGYPLLMRYSTLEGDGSS